MDRNRLHGGGSMTIIPEAFWDKVFLRKLLKRIILATICTKIFGPADFFQLFRDRLRCDGRFEDDGNVFRQEVRHATEGKHAFVVQWLMAPLRIDQAQMNLLQPPAKLSQYRVGLTHRQTVSNPETNRSLRDIRSFTLRIAHLPPACSHSLYAKSTHIVLQ